MSEPKAVYALPQLTVINNCTDKDNEEELTDTECIALIEASMHEARKQSVLKLLYPAQPPTNLDYHVLIVMATIPNKVNALIDRRILLDEENTISKIDIANILKES